MYTHLSTDEKNEVYQDRCVEFEAGNISEEYFRQELGKLGYNATDIEDIVREHRPQPAENDGED